MTPEEIEVYDATEWIRDKFGDMRTAFVEDPGGWLAYVDAPMTDEVAEQAITVMLHEWQEYGRPWNYGSVPNTQEV